MLLFRVCLPSCAPNERFFIKMQNRIWRWPLAHHDWNHIWMYDFLVGSVCLGWIYDWRKSWTVLAHLWSNCDCVINLPEKEFLGVNSWSYGRILVCKLTVAKREEQIWKLIKLYLEGFDFLNFVYLQWNPTILCVSSITFTSTGSQFPFDNGEI